MTFISLVSPEPSLCAAVDHCFVLLLVCVQGGRRSHHTDPHPHNHGPKAVKGSSVTVGGHSGYIARRVFHVVGFAFLPFFYYILLPGIYDAIGVTDFRAFNVQCVASLFTANSEICFCNLLADRTLYICVV